MRILPKQLDNVEVPLKARATFPARKAIPKSPNGLTLSLAILRTAYHDTARMVAQARLKPLVVDIDDDFVNLPVVPTWKEWQGGLDGLEPMAGLDMTQIAAMKAQGWGEVTYKGNATFFPILPRPS